MIDRNRIEALLDELSVPITSPRTDDIRLMIDEAVRYCEDEREMTADELSLVGTPEAEDAAWITIEPAHVSFYV